MEIRFPDSIRVAIETGIRLQSGEIFSAPRPDWGDDERPMFFDEIVASEIIKIECDKDVFILEQKVDFFERWRKLLSVQLLGFQSACSDSLCLWEAECISYLENAGKVTADALRSRLLYKLGEGENNHDHKWLLECKTVSLIGRHEQLGKFKQALHQLRSETVGHS